MFFFLILITSNNYTVIFKYQTKYLNYNKGFIFSDTQQKFTVIDKKYIMYENMYLCNGRRKMDLCKEKDEWVFEYVNGKYRIKSSSSKRCWKIKNHMTVLKLGKCKDKENRYFEIIQVLCGDKNQVSFNEHMAKQKDTKLSQIDTDLSIMTRNIFKGNLLGDEDSSGDDSSEAVTLMTDTTYKLKEMPDYSIKSNKKSNKKSNEKAKEYIDKTFVNGREVYEVYKEILQNSK